MPDPQVRAWGRVVMAGHRVARPRHLDEVPDLLRTREPRRLLAIGLRRSYGDSGLNAGGALIDMSRLDRFIAFNPNTGIVRAQAGLSLAALLDFALPRGLVPPVLPGTKFVTLGGAVANDIHGKNHHRNGTFGRWVRGVRLLRTDGIELELRPADRLFAATVGGLGLTGVITEVELQLVPSGGSGFMVESVPFDSLGEFFSLAAESVASHEHAVAWVDCLARGSALGRGIFSRAVPVEMARRPPRRRVLPLDLPAGFLNRTTVQAFNSAYMALGRLRRGERRVGFDQFLFPLDAIADWNRMYGRAGFHQYQSVVPPDDAEAVTRAMLEEIGRAGEGSFLAVLKTFGALPSPGLLSFPREGTTLAVDLPNRGDSTLALMQRLDDIVGSTGGRIYPAKDGRMAPALFRAGYPNLQEFRRHIDPGLVSSFWRRMEKS